MNRIVIQYDVFVPKRSSQVWYTRPQKCLSKNIGTSTCQFAHKIPSIYTPTFNVPGSSNYTSSSLYLFPKIIC